jgi:multiple sugar transport system ATP-binding protein
MNAVAPISPHATAALAVRGLTKTFRETVLHDIELDAAPGEIVAITGPSGAGKTTLFRILAGLKQADKGNITLAGRDLSRLAPGARRVAFMFESYALYPHLSVEQNVRSPLLAPNAAPASTEARQQTVRRTLELLEIAHLSARMPAALSGGEKQRVALARTIVQQPALFLLDEPISHLDAKLRHKLRSELRRLLVSRSTPALWSTPDGMEALSVADRVAVIYGGRIEQVGTPEDVWLYPGTVRVARLIGDPPVNLITGRLETNGAQTEFVATHFRLALPPSIAQAARSGARQAITLGIRPGDIAIDYTGRSAITAELYSFEPFGKHAIATLDLGEALLKAKLAGPDVSSHEYSREIGTRVALTVNPSGLLLFDAATGRAL